MLLKIKRFLASNKYFWKYRHFFQKNIFQKSYGLVPIKYFNRLFKQKKIISVLDFGCATGDKLEYFVSKGTKYIYGIDINKKAIQVSKKKFKSCKIIKNFDIILSEKKIFEFLKQNNLKRFDLIILDRVCYILDLKDLSNIFRILSKKSKYIYIDDFFYPKKFLQLRKKNYGYNHTCFDLLLKKFSFKKIFYVNSPYKKVLNANAKSALFENYRL